MPRSSFVKIKEGYPTIDVGAMRHKLLVFSYRPVDAPVQFDVAGPKSEEAFVTEGWAAIDQNLIRGTDTSRDGQTTTVVYPVIAMWYQRKIEPDMRIRKVDGITYLIQSIENVLEMNVVMELTCIALGKDAR